MQLRYLLALAVVTTPLALAACSSESPDSPSVPSGVKDSGSQSDSGDDIDPDAGTADSSTPTPGAGDGGNKGDGAIPADAAIPPCPSGTACPIGALCKNDGMCSTNVCFTGGQTSFCTKKCAVATQIADCPKPDYLEACNSRGYCKLR